ncbi:MAG TPA: ComEC/Rec2 family competence protein, partial [Pyrinomonadaceae bacterium]
MMHVASHHASFAPHPLALLGGSLAAGILAARLCSPSLAISLVCGIICSLIALLCLARNKLRGAALSLLLAFFCAGASLGLVEQQGIAAHRVQRLYQEGLIAAGEPVEIEGVLEREPETAPDSLYLTLRVEKLRFKNVDQRATGLVWLAAPVRDDAARTAYRELGLHYGSRLSLMTRLNREEGFRNPGVSALTEYLERRGYEASGIIKSPLLIERLDGERVFLPLFWLYQWRERLLAEIGNRFSAETAGVLKAALLGNRYYLSRGAAERFRMGGTFHVLVISGLHISFIGALIFLFMRRITGSRAWQFAASVGLLWTYTIAVSAESSVVRAALMFSFVALAPVMHRRAGSLNALGGAGLVLLLWRPSDLFDPSFQLTFLSVLMIVTIAWPLLRRLQEIGSWYPTRERPHPPVCPSWVRSCCELLFWSEKAWQREMARAVYSYRLFKNPLAARLERLHVQRPLRYVLSAVIVSASVQVGLLPLLLVYFHRVSLASIALNIFVGLLMAALSLVALAALIVVQFSTTLAAPLVSTAE